MQRSDDDVDEEISSSQSEDLDGFEGDEFNEGSNDEDDVKEKSWEQEISDPEHDTNIEAKDGDEDVERHRKTVEAVHMLHKKEPKGMRRKRAGILSEAYPESEFNLNPHGGDTMQQITVEDLISPLQNTPGFGSLRKRVQQLEKKGSVVDAPLPKALQDRLNRKAGYEKTSDEISKWQDIVKRNREAPTLVFTQRPDLTAASTAELAAKFVPTTNLEKEVMELLQENGLVESTTEANTALGHNKLTMDEVKERREKLAKLRSMLSYHEAKAKRMKKIKSKTYHRLLQNSRKGNTKGEDLIDPETLKEAAIKAEFKRAQERMTLKHKNTSKWAKRIIKRGIKAKEDGSREALADQLRTHAALTRKIHAIDDATTSEESSGEEDSETDSKNGLSSPSKPKTRILAKAKIETLKLLEGNAEAEIPTSGLFSLPFMTRAIEKKRKQAQSEAFAVLEELEQLENDDAHIDQMNFNLEKENEKPASYGRLAFGDMAKSIPNLKEEEPDMLVEGNTSDEAEGEDVQDIPEFKKKAFSSRRRKPKDNAKINPSGVELQTCEKPVTDAVWKDGCNDLIDFNASVEQGHEVDNNVPKAPDVEGPNVPAQANPWLYGPVQGIEGTFTKEKNTIKQDTSGPLVVSASLEVLTSPQVRRKRKKKKAKTQKSITPDKGQDDKENERHLSSNDSEEEENQDVKEPRFQLSAENESQLELIQRAFAGDDVEADFQQMKVEALNDEVPLGESVLSLPGWGQWTDVQKKKGPPQWILKQQEELRQGREQALSKRKDFKMNHVMISEKMDKKFAKFMAPQLPFPFTSREIYEKSTRMPLGREFNTDQGFRDLIRPAVLKDAGVIIDPIKYKMSETRTGDSLGRKQEILKKAKSFRSEDKRKRSNTTNSFVSNKEMRQNTVQKI
ncbi:hypothetical protein KP509_29G001000 [Ceratopteris richardii]|nr:hypothetical protein KP509_29G001000 [Ceratopteris richardii]